MAIGIKFKEYVKCEFCTKPFEKGTGHLCFCPECDALGKNSRHPMCNSCYEIGKQNGYVKDNKYKKNNIDENLRNRLI